MRNKVLAAGVLATLAAAVSIAAPEIDYSDFDDEIMRSMDDAIKDLDSNLGGQDAEASLASAQVLREGFAWAEKYFTGKVEAPRGVEFARAGQENLAAVVQAIEARNFDAANSSLRGLVRSCKTCHEAYKPPE
jgi:cytochrome c556